MRKKFSHEQQKGNLLKEYDGFAGLAAIDPDFCLDVCRGHFGRLNGGDFNAAESQAQTAVTTIQMMANGIFGFDRAAKSVRPYFTSKIDVEKVNES